MNGDEAANEEVERFAADPNYPLFDLLRPRMAQMLEMGLATNLREAYFLAARAHATRPTPSRAQRVRGFGVRFGIVLAAAPAIFGAIIAVSDKSGWVADAGLCAVLAAIAFAIPASIAWAVSYLWAD